MTANKTSSKVPAQATSSSSSSSSSQSLAASRTSTVIVAFFVIIALCSIALVIGGELFLSFQNSSPSPSSFVIAGVYPPVEDFAATNTSQGPLAALLSCIHPSAMECVRGDDDNDDTTTTTTTSSSSLSSPLSLPLMTGRGGGVLASLSDFMNKIASSGAFWCEAVQQLSFDQVKEKLVVDGSVIVAATSSLVEDDDGINTTDTSTEEGNTGLFPSTSSSSSSQGQENYVIIVGFNSTGVLTIDPRATIDTGYYGFIPLMPSSSSSSLSENDDVQQRTQLMIVKRGGSITVGCPGYTRPSGMRSIGSGWPDNMSTS